MLPAPPPPPGARGLLCGSDERPLPTLIFSCIVVVSARAVESRPPDFLPADGYRRRWIFAAPRLSSSYCAPSATRRARGRRRRASRGSGSFFYKKFLPRVFRGAPHTTHHSTTRRPARPAAAASSWYTREGYGVPARPQRGGLTPPFSDPLVRAPHWQLRSRHAGFEQNACGYYS